MSIGAHIEAVARHLLGPPNQAQSSPTQWRYGTNGSVAVEVAGERRGIWFDHERGEGGGVLDLIHRETGLTDGAAVAWLKSVGIILDDQPQPATQRRMVATYDYHDETGALLFQVVRYQPKDFRQRRPDGNGGWDWSVKGVQQVPYRLPEMLERPAGAPVYIVEGEKDADRLAKLGLIATCNAGGSGKWREDLGSYLHGATVYVLPDNDDPGRRHAQQVATSLHGIAASIRIVELPGLGHKQDVSDWLDAGGSAERLATLCEAAPTSEPAAEDVDGTDLTFQPQDIEDLDRGAIPPRQWLLSTILCRRFVTVLAASGGAGKTTLFLAWALSLAVGRPLVGDHVHKRSRVLILTFEDDIDEYRRRLRAARMHHGIGDGDVGHGWCHVVSLAGIGITLATAGKDGMAETDAVERIIDLIRRRHIDVAMFDPFVKLSDGDENDNRSSDFIAQILVRVAIVTDVAVLVAHHFRKGLAEAGNIDSARGARAIIDASRLALTLVPMSTDEAQSFGLPEEDRRRLVRVDDGKQNLTAPADSARWYRLASVPIGNGTDDYPAGDHVQAIERWQPPDFWRDLSPSLCCRIIDEIDAGLPDGERFSGAPAAKARGAWSIVRKHAPTLNDQQARKVIATWLKTKVLEERGYNSKARRTECMGLFANPASRPGGRTNG